MRTTLLSIHNTLLNNLNRLNNDLSRLNVKITSGKELSTLSDDPVTLVNVLGLRNSVSEVRQYQQNLQFGSGLLDAATEALMGIGDLVSRAKQVTLQSINASNPPGDRLTAAQEIHNLLEETIALGNSQLGDKYLFGGYRTSGYTDAQPAPFVAGFADGQRINGTSPAPVDGALPLPPSYQLSAAGDLNINGIPVPAAIADANSDIFADASADAKAAAINSVSGQTGVTAQVVPAFQQAGLAVSAGVMNAGDLVINSVDIFALAGATAVQAGDSDNALINAVNSQTAATGVAASRDAGGNLILSVADGRNLHIETSANGEAISHLNGAPGDRVSFGALQLTSGSPFMLATGSGVDDPGLTAIGLEGGAANTGENGDLPNDGLISVTSIARQDGSVRYNGERQNAIEIKTGSRTTMAVSVNGQEALMDTGIFTVLQRLENALRDQDYITATGINQATDTTALLNSGTTGLDSQLAFTDGAFTVTVRDNAVYPAQDLVVTVPVDTAVDTPDSIAQKIDGIPGLAASWDANGQLHVDSIDPDRYTFEFSNQTANFLQLAGINRDTMQDEALDRALADLGTVSESFTALLADFGARSNRIEVQTEIYVNLELSISENLSSQEDTDMTKALTELRLAETAYEAALSAAARTMELSLVNFL